MPRPYITGYQGYFNPGQVATIESGDTESSVINCGGLTLVGIYTPAALTGSTLSFLACDTADGTFVPVNGVDGTPIEYAVAAAGYYAIDPKDFQGIQFLQLVSGSAEGADRALTCTLKGL